MRSTCHQRWTLTVDVDSETAVSDGNWPSDTWRHRDAAGHEHRRVDHGYPTLRRVIDRTEPCDGACGDPDHVWEYGHWECRECGEWVVPGTVPRGVTVVVDWRRTVTFQGCTTDGIRVKGRVPNSDVDDLLRRLAMTTTPSIRDRIIGQYVQHHPDTITEHSYSSW